MQITETHMRKPRPFRWGKSADAIPAFVREPHVRANKLGGCREA